MEALLDFARGAALPKTVRANVSEERITSLTVGAVDQRAHGMGVSGATLLHHGYLTRLLHAVAKDASLLGEAPPCYTSICLNVDFPPAALHRDARNEGFSYIVAGGDYNGGQLFVEGGGVPYDESPDAPRGTDHDIKGRWQSFDGAACHHGVRPYSGLRVSVVYFCVPSHRISAPLAERLHALGFPLPAAALPRYGPRCPHHIFVCSTRRAETLEHRTLRALFADGSVEPDRVTLCLRDGEDVAAYAHLGLHTIADEAPAATTYGLPEQRRLCLSGRPLGSWSLFLDDDLTSIQPLEGAEWMTLHDLITLGFLTAEQEGVALWGLNTSTDARNLRDNTSRALGLVCGYFFGIIGQADNPVLHLSDAVQGAAEDIERSLRFYHGRGIVRLNFACAQAKTWTNAGGLQTTFGDPRAREVAHDYVVHALAREFPGTLRYDLDRPNRCSFQTGCGHAQVLASRARPVGKPCRPTAPPPREPLNCQHCGKAYRRREDLRHHISTQHGGDAPRHACPKCGQTFLKRKDMLAHLAGGRCWSTRGRYAQKS